jgi:glutathione synthase/RimK-type ligase-like ATP-grasp enzyme
MIERNPSIPAARADPRVALVTCAELPDLDPDDRLLYPALEGYGIAAEPAVWDDPDVDWSGYDLVVLRSTWDYVTAREAFLAWARRVPALANPADVVAWNTDKRYLAALARQGLPVVPTRWVEPDGAWRPPPRGEVVVKPAVSAGSKDTGRYDLASAVQRGLAAAHVERLQAAGRVAMVQPYLTAVDSYGETAVLFLDGRYSHAVRKGPLLDGPDVGFAGLYRPEQITVRTPTAAELAVARRVLAGVPGGGRLLYARVDLIADERGHPLLVELELTEPSLFLGWGDGAAQRLAGAIAARLSSGAPAMSGAAGPGLDAGPVASAAAGAG